MVIHLRLLGSESVIRYESAPRVDSNRLWDTYGFAQCIRSMLTAVRDYPKVLERCDTIPVHDALPLVHPTMQQ